MTYNFKKLHVKGESTNVGVNSPGHKRIKCSKKIMWKKEGTKVEVGGIKKIVFPNSQLTNNLIENVFLASFRPWMNQLATPTTIL